MRFFTLGDLLPTNNLEAGYQLVTRFYKNLTTAWSLRGTTLERSGIKQLPGLVLDTSLKASGLQICHYFHYTTGHIDMRSVGSR